MTDIYLADIRNLDDVASEPPQWEGEIIDRDGDYWIWPTSGIEDFRLPKKGDYIIFFRSYRGTSRLIGIGQSYGITHSESAYQTLEEADFDNELEKDEIVTIVNYQALSSGDRPDISEVLGDEVELARGMALRQIPRDAARRYGFDPPLRGISMMGGFSTEQFMHPPEGGGGPPNEPRDFGDGDDNDDGIDRTGPLLEQQYTARDAIRDASISGLQITILLFGVIVAGLSFLRDALRKGVVEVTGLMLLGAAGIGVGALLAAAIIVVSTTNPRPQADDMSKEQRATNATTFGSAGRSDEKNLLGLSEFYHTTVSEINSLNAILGGLSGGAVGIALSGIFLIGSEVLQQLDSIGAPVSQATYVFASLSALLALYAFICAGREVVSHYEAL